MMGERGQQEDEHHKLHKEIRHFTDQKDTSSPSDQDVTLRLRGRECKAKREEKQYFGGGSTLDRVSRRVAELPFVVISPAANPTFVTGLLRA